MTTITILPEEKKYRAVAGKKQSVGRTAGAALDALTAQLDEEESGTLLIIQSQRPDRFFSLDQKNRLVKLIEKRQSQTPSEEEKTELENLVEAELNGARQRAEELLGGLKP
ncbi:MAG: hypothetical protein M3R14_12725 [Acidobacteriota bacterium]|nr:hypothetical protein [Acidobacteriota bacterium]